MRTLAIYAVLAACSKASPPSVGQSPPLSVPGPPAPMPAGPDSHKDAGGSAADVALSQSGIVGGWIDKSADPCKDFFAYSCGGFTKTATIPPDRSSWGATQIVTKDNEEFLKQVLEDASTSITSSAGNDPVAVKLGAYYAACMDEAGIERAGIAPIQPLLDEIGNVKDGATAAHAIGVLHADGLSPFFGLAPTQDYGDATKVIAGLDQAGLGLPDRKYYLENKDTIPAARKTYQAHQVRMFQLLGLAPTAAKAAADHAFGIETSLAKLQQDEVARRDPHAIYHRVDREGLEKKLAPSFPWGDYLAQLGIPSVTAITVNDPTYYTAVAKLLGTTALGNAARLLDVDGARRLRPTGTSARRAVDEAFTMKKALAGVKEVPPRWRRCVHHVDGDLGELLGQSYVKARFAGDSKARAVELTKSVLAAMRVELDTLARMDGATRTAAKAKLAKMAYLVGYPDTWRRYDFAVSRTDFAANVRAADKWELSAPAREDRQAGRSLRLADDATDGQRVLRPDAQRARVARGPAPAAVLRRVVPSGR